MPDLNHCIVMCTDVPFCQCNKENVCHHETIYPGELLQHQLTHCAYNQWQLLSQGQNLSKQPKERHLLLLQPKRSYHTVVFQSSIQKITLIINRDNHTRTLGKCLSGKNTKINVQHTFMKWPKKNCFQSLFF